MAYGAIALCGTEIAYGAVLCATDEGAFCGTEIVYAATSEKAGLQQQLRDLETQFEKVNSHLRYPPTPCPLPPYAVSGTDLGGGVYRARGSVWMLGRRGSSLPSVLRACYAMSGTEIGCATRCPVRRITCDAMSGTDIAEASSRAAMLLLYDTTHPIACYAMCGTEVGYATTGGAYEPTGAAGSLLLSYA
eukprot:2605501-Rhodomonas_salina.3